MAGWLDLTIPDHAYLFGFLQGDAHLTKRKEGRTKGTLSVEVGAKDRGLLERFQQLVPVPSHISTRTRRTNFADAFECVCWRFGDAGLRMELAEAGLPEGKKSSIIAPPAHPYSEIDYFRGLLDADGSVGLTSDGTPFVSLVTDSDFIAQAFIDFLHARYGIIRTSSRNKRDGAYNIMVMLGDAGQLASDVYYEGCLALNRKVAGAWLASGAGAQRPRPQHYWIPDEDALFDGGLSNEEIALLTGRVRNAVASRRRTLHRDAFQPRKNVMFPRSAYPIFAA